MNTDLISYIKQLIKENKYTIPYEILNIILTDEIVLHRDRYPWTYEEIYAIIAYAAYICHLIPYPHDFNPDGTGVLRPSKKCLESLMLFFHTHSDELKIIAYSKTINSKFPRLQFMDTSHNLLHWGAGTSNPDFCEIDNPAHTFEVKYNYAGGGSISSSHRADEILDCLPNGDVHWYHLCAGYNMGLILDKCLTSQDIQLINRASNRYPPILKPEDLTELMQGDIFLYLDSIFDIKNIPINNNFI